MKPAHGWRWSEAWQLREAAQNGLLQIDTALGRLQSTDFRAKPGLYERARQLAAAKPPVPPRRKQE